MLRQESRQRHMLESVLQTLTHARLFTRDQSAPESLDLAPIIKHTLQSSTLAELVGSMLSCQMLPVVPVMSVPEWILAGNNGRVRRGTPVKELV